MVLFMYVTSRAMFFESQSRPIRDRLNVNHCSYLTRCANSNSKLHFLKVVASRLRLEPPLASFLALYPNQSLHKLDSGECAVFVITSANG